MVLKMNPGNENVNLQTAYTPQSSQKNVKILKQKQHETERSTLLEPQEVVVEGLRGFCEHRPLLIVWSQILDKLGLSLCHSHSNWKPGHLVHHHMVQTILTGIREMYTHSQLCTCVAHYSSWCSNGTHLEDLLAQGPNKLAHQTLPPNESKVP